MPEEKHLLVLANSARAKKHCVAGKIAVPREGGGFNVTQQWIRLADPRDREEGAVPFANTVCAGNRATRPLDIIKVALQGPCNDPDHPEDWFFEPSQQWQQVSVVGIETLAAVADQPRILWDDSGENRSVAAGYVRKMGNQAASLYLIRAPADWAFTYWKTWNAFEKRHDVKRKLTFTYAGQPHEFSVTDIAFSTRHQIYDRATEEVQTLRSLNPNVWLCLSLTKLTPEFSRKHYKICATVFEL